MGATSCSPRPSQCLLQCLEITGTQISELKCELERSKTWGQRLQGEKGSWWLGRESARIDEGRGCTEAFVYLFLIKEAWEKG